MEINNDLNGIDEPTPVETWDLAARCDAASAFWGTVGFDIELALIRDFGMDEWCRFTQQLFRSHQSRFFLPGLAKLGIPEDLPDAVRCAMYHGKSNALGGVNTRYSIESDTKAWVIYHAPTMAAGLSLYTDGYWRGIWGGWHVNNGKSLGNPNLQFVGTHMISRGDPFDAGYFIDTGSPVPEDQRLRITEGEQAPAVEDRIIPDYPDADWPEERRLKAYRNFNVEWAWDRMATAVEHYGDKALGSVKHGIETTIHAYFAIYSRAVGGSGAELAARYCAAAAQISGWDVEAKPDGDDFVVELDRDAIRQHLDTLSDDQVASIYDAYGQAWNGMAKEQGATVSVETSAANPAWRFTNAG